MGLDLIQVISGPAMGGPFLVENFDYPVGDSLGAHGWNWHSGTGTTILVTAGSLSYAGYPESGIGNSTTLFGGSGSREDMNRLFTSVTTGSVYAAVLVNVQAAATTGDYFLHYSTNPHTTSFRGRVFVKDNGAGAFQFGLSKASTSTVVYTSGTYNYNTTYLLVLKYEVVTDVTGSDDLVKLYINPVLSNPEPVSADLTNTDTGSDIGVGAIDIRQGAQAYTVQLDGIRIGTTWFDVVPVELTSFTASVANGSVRLNWTTATEVNNAGFEVERRSVNNDWQKIGYVSGSGTTTESRSYSFIDNNLNAGQYSYRLKQVDYNGTFEYSNEINVEVTSPVAFDLSQNYPNPFNPATKINFSLPAAGNVKLAVFNLLGEEVATLVNGFRAAGTYSVDFNAANLNSGLYFYRLETENFSKTMKMTLLK
ncbi:MAG: T9SS type A sorting domain-containing protein [Ignavibacteriaceae bacterium]|nr:T9SS type A sorting domain-containing protein [Ignavibacteriaceae bacterium]